MGGNTLLLFWSPVEKGEGKEPAFVQYMECMPSLQEK